MAEGGMVQNVMSGITTNPEVAAIGVAAGFVLGYALHWKRNRGMGMGGFP